MGMTGSGPFHPRAAAGRGCRSLRHDCHVMRRAMVCGADCQNRPAGEPSLRTSCRRPHRQTACKAQCNNQRFGRSRVRRRPAFPQQYLRHSAGADCIRARSRNVLRFSRARRIADRSSGSRCRQQQALQFPPDDFRAKHGSPESAMHAVKQALYALNDAPCPNPSGIFRSRRSGTDKPKQFGVEIMLSKSTLASCDVACRQECGPSRNGSRNHQLDARNLKQLFCIDKIATDKASVQR